MSVFGLSVGEALTLFGALIAIVGGYVRLQMMSTQNNRTANDAIRVAREARDEVNSLRLETAEKYASVEHLKEVEARLAVAIDRLTDRIDKLLSSIT